MVPDVLGLPFKALSAVRGARGFHPDGAVFDGTLERVAPDGVGLPLRTCDVQMRMSKGVGTPWGLPDVGGLAIRLPPADDGDTPWDVLLAGAGQGVVGRVIPWPATHWTAVRFSSLQPLRFSDRMWWLRARVTTPGLTGMKVDSLKETTSAVTIVLEQAAGSGAYTPVAQLRSSRISDVDISFDPVLNTPAGVRPQPEWVRRLRISAYRNSRSGRSVGA